MLKTTLTVSLAVVALGLLASAATAAPIRDCGSLPKLNVFNVTTRNVSCWQAFQTFAGGGARPFARRVRGYPCRYRQMPSSVRYDARCSATYNGKTFVLRWQFDYGD